MLKISTKGRYGLRALVELAHRSGKGPVLLDDLAQAQSIPKKYLYAVFGALKNAGIVVSTRGAGGGYYLAKPPEDITALEVIEVLEGPLDIVECTQHPDICAMAARCPTTELWVGLSAHIKKFLAAKSLAGMVQEYEENLLRLGLTGDSDRDRKRLEAKGT